jgi:hypothetical protein
MHSRQLIILRMDYLLCGLTLNMLALFYVIIILEQKVVLTFFTYLCYFHVFCFTSAFSKANADHKG